MTSIHIKQIRWEIGISLVLKVCLLFLLWKLCYSHPTNHSIKDSETAQHILSSHVKGDRHGS